MTEYEMHLDELEELMKKQGGNYDYALVEKAYKCCVEAHKGQRRLSGEEYYMHPFSVAKILVSLGMDSESIAAGLLHDVIEDTEISAEQVEKEFGSAVLTLVDGVTKLGKLPISAKEQQSENLRKMLIAMAQDIRVIIIKLADRLHNMRTIDAKPEQRQRDISLETIEVFAPIAHRLGIRGVKEELEDLSIAHLDPVGYGEIENLLSVQKQYREKLLEDIKDRIKTRLEETMPNVKVQIEGRVKSIHGIYRKMYIQGKDFEEIYDIYAVRVITDSLADCYNILGVMHDMFRPIPGRFKDYISTPKPNLYQSLHTTVLGREGIPFEIQIRTWEMHHTAEFGIAAHWKYKEGINKVDAKIEDRLLWIRQILDSQKDADNPEDLIQTIKTDLPIEDVFAVTPKGDVINLPAGGTVIDFAFAIHSAVGIRMVGAKADGRIVPLTHKIQTGEIIEILTTNQPDHGPSRDWLNIAVTTQAKSKIRNWFKKEKRTENIASGRAQIERDFARNGIRLSEEEYNNFLSDIARRQKFPNVDEFYAAIGYGGVLLSRIMPRIKEDYAKLNAQKQPKQISDIIRPSVIKSHDGVIVEGIENCLIKFSRCCSPLPGDDIIGFITRGHGVSVHKRDCNNVPRDISTASEPERWIKASWAETRQESFKATLLINGLDRNGLLADVTMIIAGIGVPVHNVNARQVSGGNCIITLTMSVQSVEHLRSIIQRLEKIEGVYHVERSNM
ncbi:MAG: bifunctional (p)ppGpp synthetase/guanosine-3',5'-bis(diphosphate) 3'-pyrophosphohydrolase [Ruminococcaceae bacterium]|nr:bifunctional (p)ppGpp synthetase/guanosine-3',5'-bis(diphosphate) 3'-pyrophosphohydrolase [Oscillospiraceae bacterium]